MTTTAQDKAALRARIAARRRANAAAAGRVLQPLRWIDDGIRTWQKISPLARGAAGSGVLMLLKLAFPPVGKALGWTPVARRLWRFFRARRNKPAS